MRRYVLDSTALMIFFLDGAGAAKPSRTGSWPKFHICRLKSKMQISKRQKSQQNSGRSTRFLTRDVLRPAFRGDATRR